MLAFYEASQAAVPWIVGAGLFLFIMGWLDAHGLIHGIKRNPEDGRHS